MKIAFVIILLLSPGLLFSQHSERISRSQYFDNYKDIAIKEMHRSGVPASITLAQGALESGDGNSRLARNGNNHFGIKCHNDWKGKEIYEDDDAKNECFRKYASVEDSYRDHSDYLRSKTRYAFLFDLKTTDYKGWARGLKKAGYATSPVYAESLIKIIEEYNLYLFDHMDSETSERRERRKHTSTETFATRPVLERNRVKYVVARKGDTFDGLTGELGKFSWELAEYNDIREIDSLANGQVIYIQPKRNKAEIGKNEHVVKQGETMYMISQLYAVKLSRLYAMNNIAPGSPIQAGTVLHLRKAVKKSLHTQPAPAQDTNSQEEDEQIHIDLNLE